MVNLRDRRIAAGLTMWQFAAKVGVSINTVRSWEHGVSTPNWANARAINSVLSELEGKSIGTCVERVIGDSDKDEGGTE